MNPMKFPVPGYRIPAPPPKEAGQVLECPSCHNTDHRVGARFCWVCGHGFGIAQVDTKERVMLDAVETYGEIHQMLVAIEEMAELIKELCKKYRGFDNVQQITEEIADVSVVTDEMKLIFGCGETVKGFRSVKLDRLRRRIEETRKERGGRRCTKFHRRSYGSQSQSNRFLMI